MLNPWRNDQNRLWIIQGDKKIYMYTCGVYNVWLEIDDKRRNVWICGYCGSTVRNADNCPNCNGPKRSRSRQGTIDIVGILPICKHLDTLKDNFEIHVMFSKNGNPKVYSSGKPCLIAKDCKVIEKVIPSLIARNSDEVSVVDLHLKVSGSISLRFD